MLSLFSTPADALTFEKLPIVKKSDQWSVQVGEAKKGKDLVKPVKGKFNTYSLKIDKIGEDVDSVKVNLYRNEPNSNTRYSLVSCPPSAPCSKEDPKWAINLARQLNDGNPYRFSNFLLAEKATELEVEIVWTDNNQGRPMKETFTFTNQ
ncbi:hypothetical protein DFO70_1491 [Cytobacillus firmus]|uniref:Uncharacterized protein n=2 Tax=Cytobacillus TaxID=2675230 RepID=A0A366JDK5_CYTFI|nr:MULTISPECIES: hypothetical protein [Cytobacillus]RBP84927.1 hypothetical protein DFO70_1491 [Cytobacillus firmus]TDX35048.1 hypothetical protein DFO72_1331 [Cytobacillus oceanisediminis]